MNLPQNANDTCVNKKYSSWSNHFYWLFVNNNEKTTCAQSLTWSLSTLNLIFRNSSIFILWVQKVMFHKYIIHKLHTSTNSCSVVFFSNVICVDIPDMFILSIIIAASAATANSFPSQSPEQCEQLAVPYILKGVPVKTKHFPNQVLIVFSYGSSCGGIIFDSTTIITAAHWYSKRICSFLVTEKKRNIFINIKLLQHWVRRISNSERRNYSLCWRKWKGLGVSTQSPFHGHTWKLQRNKFVTWYCYSQVITAT